MPDSISTVLSGFNLLKTIIQWDGHYYFPDFINSVTIATPLSSHITNYFPHV